MLAVSAVPIHPEEVEYVTYIDDSSRLSIGSSVSERVSIAWPQMEGAGHAIGSDLIFSSGLAGIGSYTSSPNGAQIDLLESLGYPMYNYNMNAVRTSLLPADSLLGIRYVWTDEKIAGLIPLADPIDGGSLRLYENPFVLPLALSYISTESRNESSRDPFARQSELYDELLGEPSNLYTKCYVQVEEVSSSLRNYSVSIPTDGNWGVYARLQFDAGGSAEIHRDAQNDLNAGNWLAPDVFSVPIDANTHTAHFSAECKNWSLCSNVDIRLLDLDRLAEITDELSMRGATVSVFENGHVCMSIEGAEGESLYMSIPADRGWHVTRNGIPIKPEVFADCLMEIPLLSGKNEIEMVYELPGMVPGAILTIVGTLFVIAAIVSRRFKSRVSGR